MPDPNISAELDRVSEILRLYAKALSGREIHLVPLGASSMRGAGWVTPSAGEKTLVIKLPAKIDRFPTENQNFAWYKVILTHQAGHVEFGTFEFSFAQPSRSFDDWRPLLARNKTLENETTDFAKFWKLFPDPELGAAIFDQVEDARVDTRVLSAYPGIRPLYRDVTESVLEARPRLSSLPLREAFLEALVHLGLGADPLVDAPLELKPDVELGSAIFDKVRRPDATVEDSAEAALRLYEIAARLPNRLAGEHDDDHREQRAHRDHAPDQLREPVTDEADLPFTPLQEIEFRLENDRKTHQFLTRPSADESDRRSVETENHDEPRLRDQPFTYLYPEWDFRRGRYRQNWCRVRERCQDEGTSDFYVETLAEHRPLVGQVTRRFEHFLPELFRKVTRRYDGEDLDLDGIIERVVDQHAGRTPEEKVYWRRERTQRDVAVALLLDMSATTNEFVQFEAAKAHRPSGPSAQAYSDYLQRIAAGIDERGRPLRRRAIEVEKQASIILCQALEKIGDSYAIYAFPGSGRGEVEFSIIKEFQEPLTQRIARRIDCIEPAHATRMGAAIRHAMRKLERVEANTRLLFLLSDGRPYDRDYGRDAEDQEYALHDTRQALLEAKRRRIRPFCLTIDRNGEDYLRRMCDEISYEVVTKVEELPIRLVAVYPKLTA